MARRNEAQPTPLGGEAKKRRVSSNKLPEKGTHIPGVNIIHQPGTDPRPSLNTVEALLEAARRYVELYPDLQAVTAEMKEPEKIIRTIVGGVPGLSGIEEEGKFRLPVSNPQTRIYQREQLREAAGEHYGEIVTKETVVLTANLAPELGIEPDVLLGALGLVLRYFGVPDEEIKTRLKMDVALDVDEKVMGDLIEGQAMALPGNAVAVKKGTPTINKPTVYLPKTEQSS